MNPGLEVALKGRFGRLTLDVAFSAPAAGVTALVGRSGSGKTTLLRCIAGLERAKGRVSLGEEVWQDARRFTPSHRRAVGYVFQQAELFPHMTLRANLRYGLDRAAGRGGPPFEEVAALLNLEHLLDRSPGKLSGGERQRGAIARALLSRPRLLLMDEPTASLDAEAKAELLPYLERLRGALAVPILYVGHDALEIERLADRVLVMRDGAVAPFDRAEARRAADGRLDQLSPDALRALAASALMAGLERPGTNI